MKKLFTVMVSALLPFTLLGCGDQSAESAASEDGTYEVAMITDCGNIDDRSFNQTTWEGVKAYGEESGKSHAYYRPDENSSNSREEYMRKAIENGAKIVVCPGYLFEDSVYKLQEEYPDIDFLLIDGKPHAQGSEDYKITDNTHCIVAREEQAGFFAGYGVVKEGFKNLGFCGGMAVPAVVRFGSGFIQGADYAAKELGLDDVTMKYFYSGVFWPTDDLYANMNAWYTDGVECVFTCGAGQFSSVTKAAEANGGVVVGVDVNQAHESETMITSAMKNSAVIAHDALKAWGDNNDAWPEDMAGKQSNLGVGENAVCLPTDDESWRFENFTVEEYNELVQKMIDGEITVNSETNDHPAVDHVSIEYLS